MRLNLAVEIMQERFSCIGFLSVDKNEDVEGDTTFD